MMNNHSSAHGPWLTIVALLLSAVTIALWPAAPRATSYWSRTYGGPGTFEEALDLRELPDHSILIAGYTDSFGTMTGDAWWIRIDENGTVLEERVHGNSLPGGAAAAHLDEDGGMAVVGAHTLDIYSDRDAWIHHVDADGIIDWAVCFADPGMHAFYDVAPADGGGYIATS